MEVKASAKYLRTSPRKMRELTRGWRGLPAERVLEKLSFSSAKDGTTFLIKVVKQALANAKNNFHLGSDLTVKKIEVSEGASLKRMDKSHGARFDRGMIKKRTAHVFLVLEEKQTKNVGAGLVPARGVGADLVSARLTAKGHNGTKS